MSWNVAADCDQRDSVKTRVRKRKVCGIFYDVVHALIREEIDTNASISPDVVLDETIPGTASDIKDLPSAKLCNSGHALFAQAG